MSANTTNSAKPAAAPPIQNAAEAENLVRHLLAAMDALVATVEQETALVRSGRLKEAIRLEAAKSELARLYMSDTARVKANLPVLSKQVPEMLAALRKQHDTFNALLQINLTVLATAHAVSEGIVRGVSGEIARKSGPQTYGSSGRTSAPSRNAAQPLAISRTL